MRAQRRRSALGKYARGPRRVITMASAISGLGEWRGDKSCRLLPLMSKYLSGRQLEEAAIDRGKLKRDKKTTSSLLHGDQLGIVFH